MTSWTKRFGVLLVVGGCSSSPSVDSHGESTSTSSTATSSSAGVTQGSSSAGPESESASDSDTGCECPRCPCSPIPRWVLRDKDGQRLNALVQPLCGRDAVPEEERCFNEFTLGADDVDFPCVRIINYEGTHVNILYELSTGRIELCMFDTFDEEQTFKDKTYLYLTPDCQGTPHYRTPSISDFRLPQKIEYADHELWYLSAPEAVTPDELWLNSLVNDECEPTDPGRVYPFRKVPDWVRDLLSNPPYTLTIEYR